MAKRKKKTFIVTYQLQETSYYGDKDEIVADKIVAATWYHAMLKFENKMFGSHLPSYNLISIVQKQTNEKSKKHSPVSGSN